MQLLYNFYTKKTLPVPDSPEPAAGWYGRSPHNREADVQQVGRTESPVVGRSRAELSGKHRLDLGKRVHRAHLLGLERKVESLLEGDDQVQVSKGIPLLVSAAVRSNV